MIDPGGDLLKRILAAMGRNGYTVFHREYDLNIVGIRASDLQADTFNDLLTVFHFRPSGWAFYALQATTDPGAYHRLNPENVSGVGAIVPGQYRSVWKRGLHQGKYPALVQVKPMKVYRDNDRDALLEFDPAKVQEGIFGNNLHRAKLEPGASLTVGKWSAGCQVLAANEDLDLVLSLMSLQEKVTGADTVSYTLLEERDL